MPRFELGDEAWEILQDGARLLLHANGKDSVRKFVSPDHAAVQYTKLIAEKEAAGWQLVAGKRGPAAEPEVEPSEPELERAIVADPYDRDAYAIYGDWYQTRQHPRGELIALQLAGDDERKIRDAEQRYLTRYKAELLGPLAKHIDTVGESPFRWEFGFIHKLDLDGEDTSTAAVVQDVVAHASGRFVAEVTLREHDPRALEAALAALRPETLRVLKVVTGVRFDRVDVIAKAPLVKLALSAYDDSGSTEQAMATLARVAPTLEQLHLRLCGDEKWAALEPLFVRTDLRLKRLAIRSPALVDAALDAIAQGPFAAHLERLDFALTDPDTGVRELLAHRARFTALREVVVSSDRVTPRALAALREVVKVSDVRTDPDDAVLFDGEDYFDEVRE